MYRSQEMRKFSAYKVRENARRPTTHDDWRIALESKQGTQVTSASQGQASRARQDNHQVNCGGPGKRRRSNTRSPGRGYGNSPTPGPSRGRGAYRGRSRGRGGPPAACTGSLSSERYVSPARAVPLLTWLPNHVNAQAAC